MYRIPQTFSEGHENYITLPTLKYFAKAKKNENFKTTDDRETIIKSVEEYANRSDENIEEVQNWLDTVIKEGIKDIYIKYIEFHPTKIALFKDINYIKRILDPLLINRENMHICNNIYSANLSLVRYDITHDTFGTKISLYYCKMIHTVDLKGTVKAVAYPMFIDLYIETGVIISRAKSKSNMFEYMPEGFEIEKAKSTTVEKTLRNLVYITSKLFGFSISPKDYSYDIFRSKLYILLDKYTNTPEEILSLMKANSEDIETIKEIIKIDICKLNEKYNDDINFDVENMVEKYFSITYPDKDIFTQGRDAYPLKLKATDEEDSKVEQIAGYEEPLQSRALFFDNKKMLQKNKVCDGITFMFERKMKMYFAKWFPVRIVANNDYCYLKFTEYVQEEDINHVLFSIIEA
jgi:hypothetical protein